MGRTMENGHNQITPESLQDKQIHCLITEISKHIWILKRWFKMKFDVEHYGSNFKCPNKTVRKHHPLKVLFLSNLHINWEKRIFAFIAIRCNCTRHLFAGHCPARLPDREKAGLSVMQLRQNGHWTTVLSQHSRFEIPFKCYQVGPT